jgi:hypothetical protein
MVLVFLGARHRLESESWDILKLAVLAELRPRLGVEICDLAAISRDDGVSMIQDSLLLSAWNRPVEVG